MNAKHKLTLNTINDDIVYDDKVATIIANKNEIQINCTSITIEVLKSLLDTHSRLFNPDREEKIIQLGDSSSQLSQPANQAWDKM